METTPKPRQIQVLETVLLELDSVKKNAKIYQQQPNSNIFFLANIDALKTEKKKELEICLAEFENDKKGT